MSSRLQLDVSNLSLGRRCLVNAYEVKADIGVIAGNAVWSMPERFECDSGTLGWLHTFTFFYKQTCVLQLQKIHHSGSGKWIWQISGSTQIQDSTQM